MSVSLIGGELWPLFFSQRNDARRPENPDTESPALSTCSNADIFRRMNSILGNALDFTGVCSTPNSSSKQKPDLLCGDLLHFCLHTRDRVNFELLACWLSASLSSQ